MIGETISHYKILEKLGEGGMGVVYRARDTKLDRDVAIKLLPPHLSSNPETVKRFIHEAKAASALNHSAIGVIHEIDETEDGQTFIAMALYEGGTLREKIDSGDLTGEEAVTIASQIASGLARAHEKGIIHRDIKPQNILLTRDGEAKIIDFGLAKLAGRTKLTRDGSTLGTAAYMSPEQARGEEVDNRSDIFSLGTILYEMLAGEPPFTGEHEAAVLYGIVHEEPKPLSLYRSDIPVKMQRIVNKTLDKDPNKRYQSTGDVLADLNACKNESKHGWSGEEQDPATSGTLHASTGRWRIAALALAVVSVAVVAWYVQRHYRAVSPDNDFALAVVDFRDLANPDDVTRSAGIAGLLHVGLVEGSPCRVVSPQLLYDRRRRLFGDGRGPIEEGQSLEVARECGATLLLSGQIFISGESPYVIWQLVDTKSGKSIDARRIEGQNLATLADEIIIEVLPLLARACEVNEPAQPPPVSEMTTASPEAYEHYVVGKLASETRQFHKARPEFEQAIALDSTFALAYYELSKIHAYILIGAGQRELTRAFAEKAWKYRSKLNVKDLLRLEAWREQLNDRVQHALEIYRDMLLRWPDDKELLKELGLRYTFYWYFIEAIEVSLQGSSYYPDEFEFVHRTASCLSFLGRQREALELLNLYAEQHQDNARVWIGIASRYLEMALPDSAEIAARRAREIDGSNLYGQGIILDCEYYRGNLEGAIEGNERALTSDDLLAGQRISALVNVLYHPSLPILYMEDGQFGKALECFERARPYGSDTGDEIFIDNHRNRLLLRMGRATEVLRWAREVPNRTDIPRRLSNSANVEVRALVALDSLKTARSVFAEIVAADPLFGRAHLFPQDMLRTEIALAEGDPETALTALHDIKRRGMLYSAGLWYIEWREALARAHRIAGRLDEAAAVHEKMLRDLRGHFISHYELGQIYEEMGRTAEAARQYEIFLEKWKDADEGLPQPEDARRRLTSLTSH
jgi:tetratricopeptide (TPR) repeat protein